jgi:hypothetical protein
MIAIYEAHGVRFAFPENWKLEEPPAGPEKASPETTVTVTSPGTAFWSLTIYRGNLRPAELLAEALTAMQAEYPALEYDIAQEEIEDELLVGYDLSFFCFDFCNTATLRGFQRGDATYLMLSQAEDHELADAAPVFRAMTTSLLREVAGGDWSDGGEWSGDDEL